MIKKETTIYQAFLNFYFSFFYMEFE